MTGHKSSQIQIFQSNLIIRFIEHDACTENQCENGGTCIDTYHGYVCECPSTFIGKNCQFHKDSKIIIFENIRLNQIKGLDACYQNNCSENGSCRVNADGNSYHCLCDEDYAGERCEICKYNFSDSLQTLQFRCRLYRLCRFSTESLWVICSLRTLVADLADSLQNFCRQKLID